MCDVDDIRGKAGTGSVLSLDAVGKQELFLNGTDSVFQVSSGRHSNFSLYQSSIKTYSDGSLNWPFGKTILVTLKPQQMGDLLKNMYMKCTMPLIDDVSENFTCYCDQLGRSLINSITFSVDSTIIETVYGDWNVIRDQLYLSDSQKIGLQSLINGGQPEGSAPNQIGPMELYIPLNFFFANNDSTFFPVCAISQQKIFLQIEFNQVSFFSNTRVSLSLPNFEIVYEQIIVTPEERLYLQESKLLIETVNRQSVLDIPSGTQKIKNFLVPNIPVESFHWFYRPTIYETQLTRDSNIIFNRFNFSNTISTSLTEQAKFPILSDATFYMNSASQLGFLENSTQNNIQTSNYFKYLEPLSASLSSPTRNVYTYSFAMDPLSSPLTGALDFSQLKGNNTFIDTSILANSQNNDYRMHMFYIGLVTLQFSGGFMKQF